MDNYINKCAICGKPILGYWYALGKNNICQSCGASVTVYDLFMRDLVDIKPDIIDSDSTLVTKAEIEELDSKSALNAAYGKAVNAVYDNLHSDSDSTLVTKDSDSPKQVISSEYGMVGDADDDGYHYTDKDVAIALEIISDVKAHGCKTEREFFDECQKLWDAGVNDADNILLIRRKQYEEIMPSPRYEGDTGNETWDVMYHLWG